MQKSLNKNLRERLVSPQFMFFWRILMSVGLMALALLISK